MKAIGEMNRPNWTMNGTTYSRSLVDGVKVPWRQYLGLDEEGGAA